MRKRFVLTICLSLLALAGCSNQDNFVSSKIEKYIIQTSVIEDNEDYQTYLKLKSDGELNEAGEYMEPDKEDNDSVKEEKQVRVTIAQNSFLKIDYFYDAGLTEKVEGNSVFLNPGDKLYCSQPESRNPYSNTYVFSEFQIYEFKEDGSRGNLWITSGEESLVIDLPKDFVGTELSVMPVGKYEKRELTFNAFYYDDNGEQKKVPGVWMVNDTICTDMVTNVEPSDAYIVKFEYDKNVYYYVSANPSPYSSDVAGYVEFKKATALNSTDSYSVQLHKLIKVRFSYDKNEEVFSVEKNGVKVEELEQLNDLKVGDKLTVTTTDGYRMLCNEIAIDEPESADGGFKYTVIIPPSNETEYNFKISKTKLTVTLDKSVGYDMAFDILSTGGKIVTDKYYSKKEAKVDETIGVEEKLIVSAGKVGMNPGTAVKVYVEKKDGNGQITKEIKYITATPGVAQIDLYDGEITNWNKIYKEIEITISVVDVTEYVPRTLANAVVQVKTVDCTLPELLNEGDVVEEDRKVEVSIYPESGYYVAGKKVENDVYVKEMKFAEYVSDIDSIIREHEVKKLYSVTLDNADPYGTVIYKLNGKEVEGTINLREEDELVLIYELTGSEHKIVRETDGFWDKLNDWGKNTFSKSKETVTIKVSDAIDGTTVKRSDYIKVSEE